MNFENTLSAATRAIEQKNLARAASAADSTANYQKVMADLGLTLPVKTAPTTATTHANADGHQAQADLPLSVADQILASTAFMASISS